MTTTLQPATRTRDRASVKPAPVTVWTIDPAHTHVEFAVRHMMIATVKGRFADVSGTLVIDEANPANSSVEARIAAASVDTRESNRDAHLRSADFLDAGNYPYLTFRSTQVESRGNGAFAVHGELTIRGVTRPVVLDAEYLGTNKSPYGFTVAAFSARTTINRKDYGLNWNAALETGGVLVGDEVRISLEVEAIQQPAAAALAA